MPTWFRIHRKGFRALAQLVCGCGVAAMLSAAAPEPLLEELDEVAVTAKVRWPIEDYLEFPQFDSVVVSPDGRHVATGWSEMSFERRLSVYEYPSMKPLSNRTLQTYYGVTDLRWLDAGRLLVQPDWPLLGFRRLRNPMGTMEVRNIYNQPLYRLFAPPPGTLDAFVFLRMMDRFRPRERNGPQAHGPVRAVGVRADEQGKLLIQTLWTAAGSRANGYGVFRMDLATGKHERVAALPLPDAHVMTGPEGKVALAWGVNDADEQVVYYLPEQARSVGRDWQLVIRSKSGGRGLIPIAWTGRDEEYFALEGRDTPTRAVVVWNATDNSRRILYQHPDADMDEAWLDPQGRPWMFSGLSHFPVYWYPDPAHPLAVLHREWAQRLAPEHVEIMNATDDLSTAVIRVSSGGRPTIFLLVDVGTGKSSTGMSSYPKLRGRRLSPVEAIGFHARDGLMIHGYLTTPLDRNGEKMRNAPLLVIAHNGPRDGLPDYRYLTGFRYDFERQLFASRGYAVLEVNPRGSAGRGVAFEQAGDGKWGAEVQDDFADAVRWAIKDGVAAAGKVCFYGAGYGAYSAMMAAAREPELFQCVIGLAGVYDLPRMSASVAQKSTTPETAVRIYDSRQPLPEDASPELRNAMQRLQMEILAAEGLTTGGVMAGPGLEHMLEDIGRNLNEAASAVQKVVEDELQNDPRKNAAQRGEGVDEEDDGEIAEREPARSTRVGKDEGWRIPIVMQRAFGSTVEELDVRSPVRHASSIRAKVLLIDQYGDKEVPKEQFSAMRGALRRAGNRPSVGTIGTENQGYFTPDTRATVYKRMLRFLDEQVGR